MTKQDNSAARFVAEHVRFDVTALVRTLAAGSGNTAASYKLGSPDAEQQLEGGRRIGSLAKQAETLVAPILDYEAAARAAGWKDGWEGWSSSQSFRKHAHAHEIPLLKPIERQPFQFLAVTPALATALEAAGERVERDFAGLIVWARCEQSQYAGLPMLSDDPVILAAMAAMGWRDVQGDLLAALRNLRFWHDRIPGPAREKMIADADTAIAAAERGEG